MQLVAHRLVTEAANCCDGVVVVVIDALENALLPSPPQEVRRMDKKGRQMSFVIF